MQSLDIDGITFSFSDGWQVARYDSWQFYRNRFGSIPGGRKAVDLLALSPAGELFLVEVKDYRQHPRTKPSELHEEISHKVVDTLAALLPASLCDDFPAEQSFAKAALACSRLRIILHLEQSKAGSRVSPRKFRLEDISLRLRQTLKSIDRRATASEIAQMGKLEWSCA